MSARKYFLSERQRLLLEREYDGRTETLDALMPHFPGVPRHQVRRWAAELGLSHSRAPRWTEGDEEFLRQHVATWSVKRLAAHLGRSRTSVLLKMRRLDLRKGEEGYTLGGLAQGLGCDPHKVKRWIDRGWLKAQRRASERTEQQGGDSYYITDAQIRAFVRTHPQEIDPRRVDWLWFVDVLLGGLGALSAPRRTGEGGAGGGGNARQDGGAGAPPEQEMRPRSKGRRAAAGRRHIDQKEEEEEEEEEQSA